MSEITAVGPRLGIFGPPPVSPTRGLTKTAGVVVEDTEGRWMNGVNQTSYPPPASADSWVPCLTEADTKDTTSDPLATQFDPVAIFLRVECSTLSLEGLKERAAVSLEAATTTLVEKILVGGEAAGISPNVNPYLGDSNITIIDPIVAYPPREALALLEDRVATDYGARGMIHATPGTMDMLSSILEEDDTGTVYTQAGTPVIPGLGYVGAQAAGNAPDFGQQFLWASGPVEVRMTPITVTDLVSSLDRSNNLVSFIAERFVLVTWDTALQAAVLVDWALPSS